jgi:hypothetical protein
MEQVNREPKSPTALNTNSMSRFSSTAGAVVVTICLQI